MSQRLPTWLDDEDLALLRDRSADAALERIALGGRLALTTSARLVALRREARAALEESLRAGGVACVARGWEGRFDLLTALREDLEGSGNAVDPALALALAHARHELEALRVALLHGLLATPALPDAALRRAETVGRSLAGALADFDLGVDRWLPALRRAVRNADADADAARWRAELQDACDGAGNPWWIDLVDPALVLRPFVAPTTVGLAGTLEPGRTEATWRFARGLIVVLFVDAEGALLAYLEAPEAFDAADLALEWLDGSRTQRAPFVRDALDTVIARPAVSVLRSEIVALRQGARFFLRRDA